jgi:hypothetical protein
MKQELSPEIQKYYNITLLGQPFSEFNSDGKIVRGRIYEGIKYYEYLTDAAKPRIFYRMEIS